MTAWSFRECLAGKAFPWNTHEAFYLANLSCFVLPSLYLHYIYLHYPHIVRSGFQRENPRNKTWELDYTHNHLHISLWFSSTPTSPHPNPWEVDSLNTYYTQSECKMRFWCCWEVLEEANRWWMQSGWIARFEKAREDKIPRSQLVAGAWRAQVHWVD